MPQLNHKIPDASYTVIYVIQGEETVGNASFLTQDWRGGRTRLGCVSLLSLQCTAYLYSPSAVADDAVSDDNFAAGFDRGGHGNVEFYLANYLIRLAQDDNMYLQYCPDP